jgi:hypothetical protein
VLADIGRSDVLVARLRERPARVFDRDHRLADDAKELLDALVQLIDVVGGQPGRQRDRRGLSIIIGH